MNHLWGFRQKAYLVMQFAVATMVSVLFVVWIALGPQTVSRQNQQILTQSQQQLDALQAQLDASIEKATTGDRLIVCLAGTKVTDQKARDACIRIATRK
jgi:hypothetical protein